MSGLSRANEFSGPTITPPSSHRFFMRILTALFALLLTVSVLNARVFTDLLGRTFEGDLVSSDGATVQIKRASDQHVFSIPIETLSAADKTFIAQLKSVDKTELSTGPSHYRLGRFVITTADAKPQALQLRINYNYRDVWKGTINTLGVVDLSIDADTDFDEPAKKGYAKSDQILLYIESKDYASQWVVLKKSGTQLSLQDIEEVTLHRKKYLILEYAFYAGDDSDFTQREPLHSGVAAVGHWGRLPGFSADWQVWQGTGDANYLWGDTLLLQHHRGDAENGMIKASVSNFSQMRKAPMTGYVHHGACGVSQLIAEVGGYYYCRVVGHTESTRGYGKIHIRQITETVPAGMQVFTR